MVCVASKCPQLVLNSLSCQPRLTKFIAFAQKSCGLRNGKARGGELGGEPISQLRLSAPLSQTWRKALKTVSLVDGNAKQKKTNKMRKWTLETLWRPSNKMHGNEGSRAEQDLKIIFRWFQFFDSCSRVSLFTANAGLCPKRLSNQSFVLEKQESLLEISESHLALPKMRDSSLIASLIDVENPSHIYCTLQRVLEGAERNVFRSHSENSERSFLQIGRQNRVVRLEVMTLETFLRNLVPHWAFVGGCLLNKLLSGTLTGW